MPADHPSPLSPDDPRISEWIDGRLPDAEAAAVAAAVQASPELARLVADIRGIRQAAAAVPAIEPPAGFVDQVMQAVAETGPGGDDERVVAEEWRSIETERLAAERVEADADADLEPPPSAATGPGRPWPWLSLAGALAAGLVVAVLLNLPGSDQRQLAMGPGEPAEAESGRRQTADWLDNAEGTAEEAMPRRELAAAPREPADSNAVASRSAAADDVTPPEAPATSRARGLPPGRDVPRGELRVGDVARQSQLAANRPAEKSDAEAAEMLADVATDEAAKASGEPAAAGPSEAPPAIPIQVWGGEGRAAFAKLLAESGLGMQRLATADVVASGPAAPSSGPASSGDAAVIADDQPFYLVGPAAAVQAFLERVGAGTPPAAEGRKAAAAGAAAVEALDAAAEPAAGPARVLVRIVEVPGLAPAAPE